MMRIGTWVLMLMAVASIDVRAGTLAIVGATIIDGNGGKPVENGVILIEGERIKSVGTDKAVIPRDAVVVSASGKYVIPGLMDANVHLVLDFWPLTLVQYDGRYDELALEAAQLALKNGITTVFDSWGPRDYLIKARRAVQEKKIVASRIYLAGNIVGLGGPFSEDFFAEGRKALFEDFASHIDAEWQQNVGPELLWMSPEQVRGEIRKYVATGVDFLKYAVTAHRLGVMHSIQFSPRVQKVIVEEAHRAGMTVQTHTTSAEGLFLAVQAGVDLMQHCDVTFGPEPIPADIIELIAERRIPCALLPSTELALKWYKDRVQATPFLSRYAITDINDRALIGSGAVLLLSTDGGVYSENTLRSSEWTSWVPPGDRLLFLGEGHFYWMQAVEQKGMKPMAALMAATRNIAQAYKVDKDLGTLAPGKIADLLVLNRNPLERAENYRSISLIIKDGEVIDRNSLPTKRLLTKAPALH